MSQAMTEAMKSAKQIQSEMVQWENRVEVAKSEGNALKKQNETLEQEIVAKRTEFQSYIASRETQLRQGLEKLFQDQQTFEAQREEFKGVLDAHLKEKAALGQEKIEFANEKSRVAGKHQLINEFIQAVRRAYNVLPD